MGRQGKDPAKSAQLLSLARELRKVQEPAACKKTSLLAEQEEKGPSAAGAPSVSGSPAPRPALTKVTVLSIVPVSEGLVELVVPQ